MVKWLGLGAFIEDTQVESLIGELRSHNMHGVAKKKSKWTYLQSKNRLTQCTDLQLSKEGVDKLGVWD